MYDGAWVPIDLGVVRASIGEACAGLTDVDADMIYARALEALYDGMSTAELGQTPILTVRELVEAEPSYSTVAARLLANVLRAEALSHLAGVLRQVTGAELTDVYPEYFGDYVAHGVELGQLNPALADFDLDRLSAALNAAADLGFTFLGLQTLYDRHLLHDNGARYGLPQAFYMRVAMGLALNEGDKNARAIEFYRLLSSHDFMCSTPTLFNSGTTRPQLSSCFLTTVPDDLDGIFSAVRDNALLAKYSGGIGND